nr:hypothetical protein [Candidatus Sigynarchaeota archaeon]
MLEQFCVKDTPAYHVVECPKCGTLGFRRSAVEPDDDATLFHGDSDRLFIDLTIFYQAVFVQDICN